MRSQPLMMMEQKRDIQTERSTLKIDEGSSKS